VTAAPLSDAIAVPVEAVPNAITADVAAPAAAKPPLYLLPFSYACSETSYFDKYEKERMEWELEIKDSGFLRKKGSRQRKLPLW
jgi:hypothetical protein